MSLLKEQLKEVENYTKQALDKYIKGDLCINDYKTAHEMYSEQKDEIQRKIEEQERDKSEYQQHLDYGLTFLENPSEYYEKSDIETKHQIVGSIFP